MIEKIEPKIKEEIYYELSSLLTKFGTEHNLDYSSLISTLCVFIGISFNLHGSIEDALPWINEALKQSFNMGNEILNNKEKNNEGK